MKSVKRAFRALHSEAYKKACTKDPLLPQVTSDAEARNTLALLPISMLALRVTKKDPHEGHNHAKPKKEKRVKGLWEVKIEHQQDFDPMMHYVWLYEGSQWMTKVWAGLALVAVFTVVLFPLWPLFMRQGVWYLSVAAMGLLVAFFGLAIVRLILFCITFFAVPPGLWIFPNLFEDVGVIESFKPLYGWQETKKSKKRSKKAAVGAGGKEALAEAGEKGGAPTPAAEVVNATPKVDVPAANGTAVASGAQVGLSGGARRHAAPTVEEADDE
jgi:translocation protein SEC62